jgi:hypothetical protein
LRGEAALGVAQTEHIWPTSQQQLPDDMAEECGVTLAWQWRGETKK